MRADAVRPEQCGGARAGKRAEDWSNQPRAAITTQPEKIGDDDADGEAFPAYLVAEHAGLARGVTEERLVNAVGDGDVSVNDERCERIKQPK